MYVLPSLGTRYRDALPSGAGGDGVRSPSADVASHSFSAHNPAVQKRRSGRVPWFSLPCVCPWDSSQVVAQSGGEREATLVLSYEFTGDDAGYPFKLGVRFAHTGT